MTVQFSFLSTFFLILSSPFLLAQTKIAVIGGGMAGVSATHFLATYDKQAEIHLFEKEAILGGNAQTVQVTNYQQELVSVDAGPQYFVKGPWNDYIAFLEETLGEKSYQTEEMAGTLLIRREQEVVLVSPLGLKLRGEKLGKLLQFKRFNQAAYDMYLHPENWQYVTIEQWVDQLDFTHEYKTNIIYPFLAASLGTSVEAIKATSAVDIIKLFAFRKPKAGNTFQVVREGMGTLIQHVGSSLPESVAIHCSSPVVRVEKENEQWRVFYIQGTEEKSELVDFLVTATHADQTAQIISTITELDSIETTLKKLTYFEAKIALHSDSSYVHPTKPAFLNIATNPNNEVVSSTMNLSMISGRLTGIYKSWVSDDAIDELKKAGKLLHLTSFWHPYITADFIQNLQFLSTQVQQIPNLSIIGGWSEGLETQNSAVLSGKKALEKYKNFFGQKSNP